MRAVVTGGSGFIGSHVVDALVAAGHEVVVLDRAETVLPAAVDHVRADVCDAATLDRVLPGADVVLHQAAKVGLGVDAQDMPDYADTNVTGTATLLAAMHRAGVSRMVLASSMVVYGEGRYRCERHGLVRPAPRTRADLDAGRFEPRCPQCRTGLQWAPVPESAPLEPCNTYAATKVAQEHLVRAWATMTGGTAIALRYHNVYGPRMPRNTPYSGVAAIFRSALERRESPTVYEDGAQLRDFVHVRDVAAANLAAVIRLAVLDAGDVRAVNVASGEPRSVGDMAAALAAEYGGPPPRTTGSWRAGDVRHIVASPAQAQVVLGFSARVRFADGMRELATPPLEGAR
ncbi:MAG: NAD-dependent epimerase/dehydratase family protein [Acidimicrobiales bacterium]